jgi:hypothetical protein
LTRKRVGISPDYYLTIHGNGKLIYLCVENDKVKVKDKSPINRDKVTSSISEFKKRYFSLIDEY